MYFWFAYFIPLSVQFPLEFGLRERRFMNPFTPNILATTNVALCQGNWHLLDMWRCRITCTLSKVLINDSLTETSGEWSWPSSKMALCTIREMGGWGGDVAGLQRLVKRRGPWLPWVISCQHLLGSPKPSWLSLRPCDPHRTI